MNVERYAKLPQILLAIGLFLAPVIGGQVYVEALPLGAGANPFLVGAFGGYELPTIAHATLAFFACASFAFSLVIRRVNQMMNWRLALAIGTFAISLGASIVVSKFQLLSMQTWFEWLSYFVALAAAIACAGRDKGTVFLISAIVAGCTISAMTGIFEYSMHKASDPGWRIFGNWNNPNAFAAVLIIGFLLSLALALRSNGPAKIACVSSAVALILAIALTQSKGVLLIALPIALVAMSVILAARVGFLSAIRVVGITALICFGVILAVQKSVEMKSGGGSASRLSNAGDTAVQSEGFRKLLWKSAAKLAIKNPIGTGAGTYRYVSARPGITPQTHFAHNSYLQVGAEGGWLAFAAMIAVIGLWLRDFFRGARSLDRSTMILRAGVFSAVIAVGAHSLIDSDFHYFGIGYLFFALLGIGLQLSADGSAPELMPPGARASGAICALLIASALFYFGAIETVKSRLRFEIATRGHNITELAKQLESMAPRDGEGAYLRSFAAATPEGQLEIMRTSAQNFPSTKILRTLARLEDASGNSAAAITSLLKALHDDPNNLPVRLMLAEIYSRQGSHKELESSVREMMRIEATPYFLVRAIPESIPTETYEARILLQSKASEFQMPAKEQAELLQAAVEGFKSYLNVTYPKVKLFSNQAEPMPFAGESFDEANRKLDFAKDASERLALIYSSLGEESRATSARESAALFSAR